MTGLGEPKTKNGAGRSPKHPQLRDPGQGVLGITAARDQPYRRAIAEISKLRLTETQQHQSRVTKSK
jgi:hypothetical protein